MALIDFIIENRTRIMRETGGNPDKVWWDRLEKTWPELHSAAKWATFEQTFKRISPAIKALMEADKTRTRLTTKHQAATRALHEAGIKIRTPRKGKAKETLPSIDGWKVQLSPDGFYRAHRRLYGKMYSCYIGKTFDLETARAKILERERRIPKPTEQKEE